MTTVPVEHRAKDARRTDDRVARRAVIRWSMRLFRREWRQQVLILVLLIVAVATATAGLAIATNTGPISSTTLTLPGSDTQLGADLVAITRAFGSGLIVRDQRVAVPGSVATVDLRSQKTNGLHPTLKLVSGRFPKAASEVSVTRQVADTLGLRVGDTWTEGGRALHVVGLVENPRNTDDAFALVAPGVADPPTSVSVVVNVSTQRLAHIRLPSGLPLQVEGISASARSAAAVAVLAMAAIGLLFVGLVAVAGFTVMAQRHLRALGMLGSLGGTDRHMRLVLLANGAIVGTVAAVVGGLTGLAGWLTFAPHLERIAGHRIDRFNLPWWAFVATLVLAVVTAIAAAWWPARSVTRMSVLAALSGRPPRPQPARHFAALGAALLGAGVLLLIVANHKRPVLMALGIVPATVGMLLLAPLAIGAVTRVAQRAPVASRVALRDLTRYQARSGAALAAATLALFIGVTIAVSARYESAASGRSAVNLPANEIVVYLAAGPGRPLPDFLPDELGTAQRGVDAIAGALGTNNVVAMQKAIDPTQSEQDFGAQVGRPPADLLMTGQQGHRFFAKLAAPLHVATPAVLAHDGIKPDQIDPTSDVILPTSLYSHLHTSASEQLILGDPEVHVYRPKIQTLDLSNDFSEPVSLITSHGMNALGLKPVPDGWLVQSARPLTNAQINTARKTAAAAGLTIESRTTHRTLSQLGTDATVVGVVLALGVLIMTVGLIRAETANDLRTLTATGATARTRRALTATTTGALAILGAGLGTAGSYLELAAWYHHHLEPLGHLPAANLLIVGLGLPIAATTGGWLLAGKEPPAIARRPLE